MTNDNQVIGPIKDSGQRTEFPTGAVRDMHQGKGRYDLMPWCAIHELALHCENGAIKYGERNVDKGIPVHSFIDSAIRHLSGYLRGMNDEPHLRAALWNIAWAIEMELNHPEMQDIPARIALRDATEVDADADGEKEVSVFTRRYLAGDLTYGEMLRRIADTKLEQETDL